MQDLSLASFVLEPDEVGEMGDCMGALARAAGRAEEDLSAFLAPGPRCYLFGSLAAAASRLSMWLLPELHVSTQEPSRLSHVRQICGVKQPNLTC